MRKLYTFSILLACFAAMPCRAQQPFATRDSIDINNINATVMVHGDMWWDPYHPPRFLEDPGINASCHYPRNSPASINFAAAIWMSAYDAGNQLHVAAQTYRDGGNDYWPGPLTGGNTLDYATSQKWSKIWKVNGSDVTAFNALSAHTVANTPPSILSWPAKGNINASGNNGVPLSISNDMAPFVDLNGNDIYEPLLGDYPDFPGDQALWWMFSDNGPAHSQTYGIPLGVEVHAMAYAYSRGTLIDNVVYYDYTLVNRSANDYHKFRLGLWDDVNVGYHYDDYIGFDSARRLGICYNGNNDDGISGGHPLRSYGIDPPQTGITIVNMPGDTPTSFIPAGAFDTYNNDFSMVGAPSNDIICDNYLRANVNYHAQYIKDDFQGPGAPNVPDTTPLYCTYIYPGDVADPTQWSECNSRNNPSDRRFVLATNDFDLPAHSTKHVVLAQVVTGPGDGGGCPVASFAGIRKVSDTAWNAYYNPPISLHKGSPVNNTYIAVGTVASSYPNPVHNTLYLNDQLQNLDANSIIIYNYQGKEITAPVTKNGQQYEIDMSMLPAGLYNIRYKNGSTQTSTKFIKE